MCGGNNGGPGCGRGQGGTMIPGIITFLALGVHVLFSVGIAQTLSAQYGIGGWKIAFFIVVLLLALFDIYLMLQIFQVNCQINFLQRHFNKMYILSVLLLLAGIIAIICLAGQSSICPGLSFIPIECTAMGWVAFILEGVTHVVVIFLVPHVKIMNMCNGCGGGGGWGGGNQGGNYNTGGYNGGYNGYNNGNGYNFRLGNRQFRAKGAARRAGPEKRANRQQENAPGSTTESESDAGDVNGERKNALLNPGKRPRRKKSHQRQPQLSSASSDSDWDDMEEGVLPPFPERRR